MSTMRWIRTRTGGDHHRGDDERDLAAPTGEELLHHVGMEEPEKRGEDDRKRRQDPAGHAALRRERPDEPADLRSFADRADDRVEDLGRVAARRCAGARRAAQPARCPGSPSSARAAGSRPPEGRPSRSSCTTRASSERAGSAALSTTTPRAPLKLWPARRAEARTCRLPGNCSAKASRTAFSFRRTTVRATSGVVSPKSAKSGAERMKATTAMRNAPASAIPTI